MLRIVRKPCVLRVVVLCLNAAEPCLRKRRILHVFSKSCFCRTLILHSKSRLVQKQRVLRGVKFSALAQKVEIVQKVLCLPWIMHITVRNLHVLRCVFKVHARKPLFSRGIVHIRFLELRFEL